MPKLAPIETILHIAASLEQEAKSRVGREIAMRYPPPFQANPMPYIKADRVAARRQVDSTAHQLTKLATEFLKMHKK